MDGAAAAGEEAEEEYASEADVLGELQEREDQLRQAAELGQSLLQRTEDLQLANEQLAAEARVANEVVEETEYRVHELTSESARLHALLEAKEAALEEKEEELRAALEEREQAEPSAIGRALDAVGEAASAERTAQAEAELRTLRQEVGELQERQAEAQHAWDQEGAGRRAAERKHKKVAAELAATQEELRERSEAASEAQRAGAEQQAAAQAERARVKDLTVRLASMEAEVARVKNRVGPEPTAAGLGLRLQEREGAASSEASKEAFDWLDREKQGVITVEDLEDILGEEGYQGLTAEDPIKEVPEKDADGKATAGKISYETFVDMMTKKDKLHEGRRPLRRWWQLRRRESPVLQRTYRRAVEQCLRE